MIRRSLGLGQSPLWAHSLPPDELAALIAVDLVTLEQKREAGHRAAIEAARGRG